MSLRAAERMVFLPAFGGHSLPLWTFSEDSWLPVIRVPFGAVLEVDFENALPRDGEYATIHWHGIRLPNDQDGVPYLVQDPVLPGEAYHYRFIPPDTGTFFFHTHCNTAEHLGRGLVGILIVEGDETEPYDADELLVLRDWSVDLTSGMFRAFTTARGAADAGTLGEVRTVNGVVDPEIALPGKADCRLRILNVDPTRIMEIGIDGADAAVVAIDGIAVPPFPLDHWPLGPGMRIDVVIRTPSAGAARLIDHGAEPAAALARLVATGPALRAGRFDPAPLRAGRIPTPDPARAETVEFILASADVASFASGDPWRAILGELCLSGNGFWSIDEQMWPSALGSRLPRPLAQLRLGGTYRLVIRNQSDILHPTHLHGFSLHMRAANGMPSHYRDTVLVQPHGVVEGFFIADNPGSWMIHCHVAEHQETGMMGYFTVA
ncbi:MAG: multicopper oxidase family protein [Bauldia sp.]